MAKVRRGPLNVFLENLAVARGFVKMHYYIEDLVEHEGKNTFGVLQEFQDDFLGAIGFPPGGLQAWVQPRLEAELQTKLDALDEAEVGKRAVKVIEAWTPRLQSGLATLRDLELAYQLGLLSQAVVTSVSALEAFTRDVTTEAVWRNRFIEKRIAFSLKEGIPYVKLAEASYDVHLAVGLMCSRSFEFWNVPQLQRHLRTLIPKGAPLQGKRDAERLQRVFAIRHLYVHQAGMVDESFRRKYAPKSRTGGRYEMRREEVDAELRWIRTLGEGIQHGLEGEKAGR